MPFRSILYFSIFSWAATISSADEWADFGLEIARARQADEVLPQLSVRYPEATLEQGYQVQKVFVQERLKQEVYAGIKGGLVTASGQKWLQTDGPMSAVLFQYGWHEAAEQPRIRVREGAPVGIELELGILLKSEIREPVANVETLRESVACWVTAVELPAEKKDWQGKTTAADLAASNVGSDHYIVGQRIADLSVDLDALRMRLWEGDTLHNEAVGGEARNGQWWNFLQQVNWAVAHGYPLQKDTLIISGALGKIHRAEVGKFRAEFEGYEPIHFELVPESQL